MPGIVGLITKAPRAQAESQLSRMVEVLRHESFYVTGTWTDESLGVYVGWATREKSFSDPMPIRNERGDITIVFAGEDFPDPNTVRGSGGRQGEANGSAYLASRYEEDRNFFKNLNGRFHGLVIDRRAGSATLFNDRFGLQRIYYHEAK